MEEKRILVHCSTNLGTSNFGDVLFSFMILKHLQDRGYHAAFYQLSPYIQNYLFNIHGLKKEKISIGQADAVVYFAGGYFGYSKSLTLYRKIRHFYRYILFGIRASLRRKPMAIIGIGAGDYLWPPARLAVKSFCGNAGCITVRDNPSEKFLSALCPDCKIHVCSDAAQCVDPEELIIDEKLSFDKELRYIFLHCHDSSEVAERFALGLKELVNADDSLRVIVGDDGIGDASAFVRKAAEILGNERVIAYDYTTPDNLCFTLAQCSLVLTSKLHVGIMSAAMGSSPIAFAKRYKVSRYYEQIGESGRCVDYSAASPELIAEMAKKYLGKGIHLNDRIISASKKNFELLDSFLEEI